MQKFCCEIRFYLLLLLTFLFYESEAVQLAIFTEKPAQKHYKNLKG